MLSKTKNIIFDVGGVLVGLDFEGCIDAFRNLGFKDADRYVSCYHPAEFFGALERGEISGEQFYNKIREVSGLSDLSNEDIKEAYGRIVTGIPLYKLQLLESLRERGFNVYALSNINEVVFPRVKSFFDIDGEDMSHYFDKIFLSFEMGAMKPDRRIYEMIIEQSGIDCKETLFIDDSQKNIDVGREMGMQVYLASENEDFSHLFE